jgi:glutaredoxin 1
MFVVIYGRPGCPYCVRAVQLAAELSREHNDFAYEYIDMYEKGLTKTDLEPLVGKPVLTVPQIFVDEVHVGGCTDFEQYVEDNNLLVMTA